MDNDSHWVSEQLLGNEVFYIPERRFAKKMVEITGDGQVVWWDVDHDGHVTRVLKLEVIHWAQRDTSQYRVWPGQIQGRWPANF